MRFPRASLRRLLFAVTTLAALVFVVALGSMARIVQLSSEQRVERGREIVQREIARTAASTPRPAESHVLGMHSGTVASGAPMPVSGLSSDVDRLLAERLHGASSELSFGSLDEGTTTVLVAAKRLPEGAIVWAPYPVAPPRYVRMWRVTVGVLAGATLLLGALALGTVVAATRGARELERTLDHLKEDLAADVPRPALAELSQVADGIENLARSLEASRKEQKELSLELERKERHAALGRVVAGVAHEIRNPLAAMKLRVDLAKTSTSAPSTFRGDLEELSLEIARLDRLVTDFLLVSGRRPARSLEISLEKLVRTRIGQLLPWAIERDVGIAIALERDVWVACDPDACARAVDNLVRNAVEASGTGPTETETHVTVSIGRTEEGHARVCVEDRGEGVPEAKLAELFLPFFTTKPDGTGLGLAVSRAVAQANGGDVRYVRVGEKTRFELVLGPVVAPQPSSHDESRPAPGERVDGGLS